jgi:hypothetical protein
MELRDQRHRRQSRDGQRRASGEASEFQIRGSKKQTTHGLPPSLGKARAADARILCFKRISKKS